MSRLVRLVLLLTFWVGTAHAQFTVPQRASVANTPAQPSNFAHVSTTGCFNTKTLGTACIAAVHSNPVAGNLRLISVTWASTSNQTITLTSSNGDSWTSITPNAVVGSGTPCCSGVTVQNFRVSSSVGGADTITLAISAATTFSSWLYNEYSHSGTISTFDGTPVLSNVTSVASIGTTSSVTTTNTSDLLWATCPATPTLCTAGSGWTARNDTNAISCSNAACTTSTTGNNYNIVVGQLNEDKVGIGPGTYTATFSTSGSTDNSILGLLAI